MITENVNGIKLIFETSSSIFSPHGIDKGTLAMLSVVNESEVKLSNTDKVLDLGCGYGVVGIYTAKLIGGQSVVMSDMDSESVELSMKNALINGIENINKPEGIKIIQSDGFKNIDDKDFSLILSNPPYHLDFSVPKHFIEKGFNRLIIGGRLIMVTKRKDWYKNKLTAIFGGVKLTKINEYNIFTAEKRTLKYANK